MKTNKAFSIIEAIIIFAVVAIVSSLGLVLYDNLAGNNSDTATSETAIVETKVPAVVDSKSLEAVDTTLASSGLDDLDDFSDLDAQLSQF